MKKIEKTMTTLALLGAVALTISTPVQARQNSAGSLTDVEGVLEGGEYNGGPAWWNPFRFLWS
jgi:hypothetical protein